MSQAQKLKDAFERLYEADVDMSDVTEEDFAELVASNVRKIDAAKSSGALEELRKAIEGDLATTAQQKAALFRVASWVRRFAVGGLA